MKVDYWAIPEKIQIGRVALRTSPGIFRSVTFPFEIPDKMKFHPWNLKLCYTPLKFQGQKPKPMVEIPHDFFFFF